MNGNEKPARILIFDTETTGLPRWDLPADHASQPRIVDIAGVLCDEHGEVVESYESLVKPEGWVVDAGAANIHGITTEIAAAQGKPIAEVMDGFDALHNQATLIVAFNIKFDDKLLRGERRRLGRPDGFGTVPIFCAMRGAAPLCKIAPTSKMQKAGRLNFKSPKLSEAIQILLKREHVGAHRAMADVMATKELYFSFRWDKEFLEAGSAFASNEQKKDELAFGG